LTNGSIQFILKKEKERPISRSYHKVIFLRLIVFTEIFSQSRDFWWLDNSYKSNPTARFFAVGLLLHTGIASQDEK